MPIVNRFHDLAEEITAWRRDFHEHPELGYDVERTAGIVEAKLREFGCDDVVTGIGRTGVVGVIRGRGPGATIGLRADMDALPILEETGRPWASRTPGKMHACGHDGHTAMLLGAAKYLAETRNFSGTVVVIFQPAEEGGAGGKAMVDDGVLDRWNVARVFGMHNYPGAPVGTFHIRPGPIMASADLVRIVVEGVAGPRRAAAPGGDQHIRRAFRHIVNRPAAIVFRQRDPLEAAGRLPSARLDAGNDLQNHSLPRRLLGTVRPCEARAARPVGARSRHRRARRLRPRGVKARLGTSATIGGSRDDEPEASVAADVAARVVGA